MGLETNMTQYLFLFLILLQTIMLAYDYGYTQLIKNSFKYYYVKMTFNKKKIEKF